MVFLIWLILIPVIVSNEKDALNYFEIFISIYFGVMNFSKFHFFELLSEISLEVKEIFIKNHTSFYSSWSVLSSKIIDNCDKLIFRFFFAFFVLKRIFKTDLMLGFF